MSFVYRYHELNHQIVSILLLAFSSPRIQEFPEYSVPYHDAEKGTDICLYILKTYFKTLGIHFKLGTLGVAKHLVIEATSDFISDL